MVNNNPYAAYQDSKIKTASPAELTLILYEGAIKYCNIAMVGLENNDFEKASTNIIKAERIIAEFRATLNHKYPVAKDFEIIYAFINQLLVDANLKKDKEPLERALKELREMRDMWKEIMKTAGTGK